MLKNRVLSTLRFFDLQDYPLTLLEVYKFLISELEEIKLNIDNQGELLTPEIQTETKVSMYEILFCLQNECADEVVNTSGFYHFVGREKIVEQRLLNYFYGIKREKLIKKYSRVLSFIPFVRGVALGGSQAMGLQKETSDIDLLIITHPEFMWLGRTLVTAYFHLTGKRRHGAKIKNRFCLNHYLAGPKRLMEYKNLYTAYEYLRLRPIANEHSIWQFREINSQWLKSFFPNYELREPEILKQNWLQSILENFLSKTFGKVLENLLKQWQMPKIRNEKFIVVKEDELSFHPDSKQQGLLLAFFKF